ncbi:MAG: DUF4910 domain-containing protein [Chloroflexota bacterium]|nr:DUF4910 domain-containing protein [Chloroflexota bacterium]
MSDYREFYRRNLPHWQPPDATLFITFRLAGSLSRQAVAALQAESEREKQALLQIDNFKERQQTAYQNIWRSFDRWEQALNNTPNEPKWLAKSDIANLVAKALHYRENKVYDLWAFCIMPNHVHLICTPLPNDENEPHPLHRILQSLKRYTAYQSNLLLGRQGAFWHPESYDRVIRDTNEFERTLNYILSDPVTAGLVPHWDAWPWTFMQDEILISSPQENETSRSTSQKLKPILTQLYPLHRTLASAEMDEALRIVGEHIPAAANFEIEAYPPGTPVWTWTVPERYAVHEAYLETETGQRIVDFADNPLHIVSYSHSVDKSLTWDELEPHLYYSEKRPSAIPWIFKYYQRDWGFCLSKDIFDQLPRDARYRAVIRSEFLADPAAGGFRVGVGLISPEGDTNSEAGELLISSHLCHPMQANDDAAGVVTAIEVARRLAENPLPPGSMSVRFWFGPETIGTIAYLAHHEDLIPRLKGGIFAEMTGNRGKIAWHHSRQHDHLLDRITRYVLANTEHIERDFAAFPPNDERVINGPGVNVPCISINRWPYDEYHTSDDNPDIIHEDMLQAAADVIEKITRIYASNYIPKRTFRGPVFLSGHGLWVDWRHNFDLNRANEKIMMCLEGQHSVFDIAAEVGLDYWMVREYIEKFRAKGFVEAWPIPGEAPSS